MHTVVVVSGAFALLLACALLGHAFGGAGGVVLGAKVFIGLWLLGAFFNMYLGTTHGFTWAQELPIFVGIFGVPAAVAALIAWKWA